MSKQQEERLERLEQYWRASDGDLAKALRAYTGLSTAEMCRQYGLERTSVHLCLKKRRPAKHIRRALEVELGLPTYSLDKML